MEKIEITKPPLDYIRKITNTRVFWWLADKLIDRELREARGLLTEALRELEPVTTSTLEYKTEAQQLRDRARRIEETEELIAKIKLFLSTE